MPAVKMDHTIDPRDDLKNKLGDISAFEIFENYILVGVYIRPERTSSGIYLSDKTREEDRYQGKIGVVLKKGPTAFEDPDKKWFKDVNIQTDDWVVFKPSDGWALTVNGVLCRMIPDIDVRGKISVNSPDMVW